MVKQISLTSRQHFSTRNDVMAAILKLRRQNKNLTESIRRTFPPTFILIQFETTEPYAFLKSTPHQVEQDE